MCGSWRSTGARAGASWPPSHLGAPLSVSVDWRADPGSEPVTHTRIDLGRTDHPVDLVAPGGPANEHHVGSTRLHGGAGLSQGGMQGNGGERGQVGRNDEAGDRIGTGTRDLRAL